MKTRLFKTVTLVSFFLMGGLAAVSAEESSNLASVRLGSPMLVDFEFEHVLPGGLGLSLGGSTLSGSDSDTDFSLTYFNVGAKKYFSDDAPSGAFVAGRLGVIQWDAEEDVLVGAVTQTYEGDASAIVAMGTIGYRLTFGGATLTPEIGLGYYSVDEIDLEYNGLERTWDADISGVDLVVNIAFGLKF